MCCIGFILGYVWKLITLSLIANETAETTHPVSITFPTERITEGDDADADDVDNNEGNDDLSNDTEDVANLTVLLLVGPKSEFLPRVGNSTS